MDDSPSIPASAPDLEAWCQHSAWVRGLARALVRDADDADDVAQDAWLDALSGPPPARSGFRRWMAAVVRNASRSRARRERRRAARELRAARPAEDPGHDPLERLDVHDRLLRTVRALDEPYRTAVVLRYLEELTPTEIAARTGTPVRTVHTRLFRALQQLRSRLDAEHDGDRRAWLAVLLPIARESEVVATGALAANGKLQLTAVSLALLALAVVGLRAVFTAASPAAPRGALAAAAAPARAEPATAPPADAARTELATPPATELQEVSPPPAFSTLRGLVIGADGAPAPDVALRFVDLWGEAVVGAERATSDPHGAFELRRPRTAGRLRTADPRWVTVLEPHLYDEVDHAALTVVVAPAMRVRGTVVDQDGAAVAGATVSLSPPGDLRARIPRILDRNVDAPFTTTTAEDGAFEIAAAPRIPGSNLCAMAPGCAFATAPAPIGDEPVLLVLPWDPLESTCRHASLSIL